MATKAILTTFGRQRFFPFRRDGVAMAYLAGEPDGDPPGIVTVNGAPGRREVIVVHRATGTVVARTMSAEDGTYRIDGVYVGEEYDLIVRDWQRVWQDNIVGAVLPIPYR